METLYIGGSREKYHKIMSILEKVGIPNRSYYDFQAGNGEGYRLEGENGSYRYEKIHYTQ